MDLKIYEKEHDGLIFYNANYKILYFSEEYEKHYNKFKPLANSVEKYVKDVKKQNEHDIAHENQGGRLRFYERHTEVIYELFNTYSELLKDENLKYCFLIYGKWLSPIVSTYYEKYFNVSFNKNLFTANIVNVTRYCNNCQKDVNCFITARGKLDKFVNNFTDDVWSYYIVTPRDELEVIISGEPKFKNNNFICDKCNIELRREQEKRRQLEREEEQRQKQKEENERINDLRSMSYERYLQTDHWKYLRKRKLRQASYKCQLCASKEDLSVHHNTYENRGNEKDEDLVVLCDKCHKKFHDIEIDGNITQKTQTQTKTITGNVKTKLFVINSSVSSLSDAINNFIENNVNEFIDIKTNIGHGAYAALLIYK